MKNRQRASGKFIRGVGAPDGKDHGATWLPLVAEQMFAANMRREREQRRMTQAALANALTARDVPLSQSAIAKLEREDDATRRPLRLVEAAAIASFFDRSLDDMISTFADDGDRQLQEAMNRVSDALGDVLAARRALAEAEQIAREREAEYDALRKGTR